MNQIYNTAMTLCRKVEFNFRKALIFRLILEIFLTIEKLWLKSFSRRIFPSGNFMGFLKNSRILRNHMFSPPAFIVFFSLFMALAAIPVTGLLHVNIITGFVCFFVFSMIIPERIVRGNRYLKFDMEDVRSAGFTLFIIGFAFFAITITYVGGIPLLKPALRYLLSPKLTIPSFLMIPGTALLSSYIIDEMQKKCIERPAARFRVIVLNMTCIFLLALLGYRTPLVAVILITIIMGYYTELFEVWEVLAFLLVALLVIMGIGYFRSVEEYSLSNLSALTFLQMRAAFTMGVLDRLSTLAGMTGVMHGKLTLSMVPGLGSGPRTLIGKLILWRTGVTITPTIFGQMIVEFGTAGVAAGMSLLALILGLGYRIMQKTMDSFYVMLYSIIMAYCLISVETGILDQLVVIYILSAAIIYFYNIYLNL
ncbi:MULTISPECIES: oligosaccharide repeat unit polymerase family protein [Methanothermobacter]|uniref:oligosaccharide repeat unit polymerase family protein n=1 Tax=Methanothermobacter TaxID=145260 RepID=UPI0013656FDF|nr:oligosaccharide repeat unit polymerase family protein [Methanothermobacter sp. THM-2]QHN07536.1 oligosaccharide repeat unit polymerase [Methanothermobacter sp. THM-2]